MRRQTIIMISTYLFSSYFHWSADCFQGETGAPGVPGEPGQQGESVSNLII